MATAYVQGLTDELTLVGATPTDTTTSINTAATPILVAWVRDYTPSITTVGDNKGNTISPLVNTTFGGVGLWIGVCLNAVGGAGHKLRVTKSSGDFISCGLAEFSGADTAALDGSATTATDAASPFDSQITTANATDMIVTIGASNSVSATCNFTAGSGFTIATGATLTNGSNGLATGMMFRSVVSTGTYGGNFTMSSGSQAFVLTFAFKDAGGGGGGAADPTIGRRIYVMP